MVFGYDADGGSDWQPWINKDVRTCRFTCDVTGNLDSLTAFMQATNGKDYYGCIYDDVAGVPTNRLGTSNAVNLDAVEEWKAFTLNAACAVTNGTVYQIGVSGDDNFKMAYAAGVANQASRGNKPAVGLPPDPHPGVDATAAYKVSVYGSITPSAGLSIPVAMHHYGHHISKIIRG